MTIILFLVDTSASMCQKAYVNGVQKTYLDIAKGAVETFLKYRQRSADCMGDRYMLLTFEDPPANVKAGWKENHSTFMNELKNLQSNGLTSMGESLRNAFDLLNLNRMQSGIDTYGQGRCPFYLEPSVIFVITDGGKYTFKTGVQQEIILPLNTQTTGSKLTKEPFRWDQRLFSLVLRMAGNRLDERPDGKVPHDDSPIEKMCEVTGGRSYRVRSHHVLNQCIESLVQKVQPGVVVRFESPMPVMLIQPQPPPPPQLAPPPPPPTSAGGGVLAVPGKDGQPAQPAVILEMPEISFISANKMIYVQKHPTQKTFPVGFWPIPEPYWPDNKATSLPPRDAHPRIRICMPCVEEPPLVRNFPVDKYEVEASPMTLQILCKREPTKCWPVFIANGIHGLELPFGYLKASPTFTQVHLVILPYNYLTLLPLLNDLFHKYGLNPPSEWVFKFSSYVRAIPQYYGPFLRRALASASVPFQLLQYILPENLDSYLSPSMATYLKTMKNNAKLEQESMCLRVFKQLKLPRPGFHQVELAKLNSGQPLRRELVSHPQLRETFAKMHSEITHFDSYNITVPTGLPQPPARNYRNPFDVPRRDLIDEIARMRENFLRLPAPGVAVYAKEVGHTMPIGDMGNYQDYLKGQPPPLREIEPTNVRQHMFGNPYKKDKHMVMVVDEADEVNGGGGGGSNGGGGGSGGGGGGGRESQPPPTPAMLAGLKHPPPALPAGASLQAQQLHAHQVQMHQQHVLMLQQVQMKKEMAALAALRPRKRKPGPIHRDYVFKRRLVEAQEVSGGAPGASSGRSPAAGSSAPRSPQSERPSGGASASAAAAAAAAAGDANADEGDISDTESTCSSVGPMRMEMSFIDGLGGEASSSQRKRSASASDDDDDVARQLVIDFNEEASASAPEDDEEDAGNAVGGDKAGPLFENGHGHGSGNTHRSMAGPAYDQLDDDDDCRPVEPSGPPPPLPAGLLSSSGLPQLPAQLFTGQPTVPLVPQHSATAAATAPPSQTATTTMAPNSGPSASATPHQLPPPPPQQPLVYHPHNGPPSNDFQAQEISKILQQCTSNGGGGGLESSGASASHRNHHSHSHHSQSQLKHHSSSADMTGDASTGTASKPAANHHTKSTASASASASLSDTPADSNSRNARSAAAANATTANARTVKRARHGSGGAANRTQRGGRHADNNNHQHGGGRHGATADDADSDANNNSDPQQSDDAADTNGINVDDDDDDEEATGHRSTHNGATNGRRRATAAAASAAAAAAAAVANSHGGSQRRRSSRKQTAASTATAGLLATGSVSSDSELSSSGDEADGGDDDDDIDFVHTAATKRTGGSGARRGDADADGGAADDGDDDAADEDARETVRQCNADARRTLFRDIRRPGRDYTQLVEHLALVRGCRRTRATFVQMCVDESLRFRRKQMADTIREWWTAELLRERRRRQRDAKTVRAERVVVKRERQSQPEKQTDTQQQQQPLTPSRRQAKR